MNKKRLSLISVVVLLFLIVSDATADETVIHRIQLPERGSLQLQVPASWKDEPGMPVGEFPTTIFKPRTGSLFMILTTPMWPVSKDAAPESDDKRRKLVQDAMEKIKSNAAETTIEIKELKGSSGIGYYFSATDRAPKPDAYKYMTTGIIRIGAVVVTFRVLTNDGQDDIVHQALLMLQTATHIVDLSDAERLAWEGSAIAVVERDQHFHLTVPTSKLEMRLPTGFVRTSPPEERGATLNPSVPFQ